MHLGNADDNSVQNGTWTWIKILHQKKITPSELKIIKDSLELKSLNFLDDRFEEWSTDSKELDLKDITNKKF